MRRLARHVFALCSAVSLALCMAACAMWVRSMWWGDRFAAAGQRHSLGISSEPGLIFMDVSRADGSTPPGWRHQAWRHPAGWSASDWSRMGPRWWDRLGFGHYLGFTASGRRVDQFVVPYYFVVVLAGLLPGLFLIRLVRARRRARTGLCPRCGYDLRASPERCPECGAGSPVF